MHYTAFHFYGMHVPASQYKGRHVYDEAERLDALIQDLALGDKSTGVGHITAGAYDRDMLFLCIDIYGLDADVELGSFRTSAIDIGVRSEWDKALKILADAAGYKGLMQPNWITVPDES